MPSDVPVGWTPLEAHPSLYDLLKAQLGVSGQQLKHLLPGKRGDTVIARRTLWLPLGLVNHREIWPTFTGALPHILHEDADVVAIHKPAGVHTHPIAYEEQSNLLSWLASIERFDLLRVNAGNWDRGCLYRLDHGTSGLMLYAKNDGLYQRVRAGFATEVRRKLYLAVVEGEVPQAGSHVMRLAPWGPQGALMRASDGGQPAELSYQPLATVNGGTLVLVTLKTGLRHQIRAQFAAMGHPLWGDRDYGGREAERMFLHCWRYEMAVNGVWRAWQDPQAELFGDHFVDLDRLLKVVLDELGDGEGR